MERYVRRVDDQATVSRVVPLSPDLEKRNAALDGLVAAASLIEIAKDGPAVVAGYTAKIRDLVAPAQGAHRKTAPEPNDGGVPPE